MSNAMGYWTLEYRHKYGTDIVLCDDELTAKITAIQLFLEAWTEIEETPELLSIVKKICEKVVEKDFVTALDLVTEVCANDIYDYDESFFWSLCSVSDSDTNREHLQEAATQTLDLLQEKTETQHEKE